MTHGHDISLSIQTFEDLIVEKRIYVDKTDIIYTLLSSGLKSCFLSRPRRFGKSLTISTLDAIFTGKRHLFKELAIGKSNYEWPVHPVIRLDMKVGAQPTAERCERSLGHTLRQIATDNDVVLTSELPEEMLFTLIVELHKKDHKKVVVLIDEYDKPLIDNLNNIEEANKIQAILKRFYGVLKLTDEYLRFIFITGVSKFTKVSVFSDLNNLVELTFDSNYAALVGLTESELLTYYPYYIQAIADEKKWSKEKVMDEIRRWYNGYRFSKKEIRVYNPWSTLSLFHSLEFREHWYTTGVPKMIVDVINRDPDHFSNLNPADFDETVLLPLSKFDTFNIETLELLPLMLHTGFLTFKSYDEELNLYQLGYPNFEVRQAFAKMVLDARLIPPNTTSNHEIAQRIRVYLHRQEMNLLVGQLNSLIASIPGLLHTPKESYYHSLIHMVFQTSGLSIRSEEWVSGGRMDTVVEEAECFYIFEFKFGVSADEAIAQIETKNYGRKFQHTGKKVVAVGISVDCDTKSIAEWKMETLTSTPLSDR